MKLISIASSARILAALALAAPVQVARPLEPAPDEGAAKAAPAVRTSGGALLPEQAAYDVLHYRLSLTVAPDARQIQGVLRMRASAVAPTESIVLDLDDAFEVTHVGEARRALRFRHEAGRLHVEDEGPWRDGEGEFELVVAYRGEPREAPRPPWKGGFTWAETSDGSPWIATSCQGEGADLWWPCKDHPSDEPEGMDLLVTVPTGLVVASNGRLESVRQADGDWTSYHWKVTTPINNYGVALNIAPYATIERTYESTTGERVPVSYWYLPENEEKARELVADLLRQLRFYEEVFGPYPFRADKIGVAETPHLGMEHQTVIAYGNEYSGNPWGEDRGFDFLLHHELGHEWWGNLVTALDWSDMWIHEGFATYAQALYVERLHGPEPYREEIAAQREDVTNGGPLAPRRVMRTDEVYFGGGADSPGGDIYHKGAVVLHSLRWVLGDEAFFRALRRMAYPDPALEGTTDGSACRFETTDGILAIAEKETERELDWFFDVYVRQPKLPHLVHEVGDGKLALRWEVPGGAEFPMPVPVRVGEEIVRVEMPGGSAEIPLGADGAFEIDPHGWVLRR